MQDWRYRWKLAVSIENSDWMNWMRDYCSKSKQLFAQLDTQEMVIFGKLYELQIENFAYVSIGGFVFLLSLEKLVKLLDNWATKHGYNLLMQKTVNELMVLGIISFIVSIITAQSSSDTSFQKSHSYFSFEFYHITILFIAFAFVLQAILLVQFVNSISDRFNVSRRTASEALIEKFDDVTASRTRHFLLKYSPFLVPYPLFREAMEFKIVERYFIQMYGMPYEFNFGLYMHMFFREYVMELVEVPPISWLLLDFILIAFAFCTDRVKLLLVSGDQQKAESVLCSALLFATFNIFYLSLMYILSSKYFSGLLMEALAMDNIECTNKGFLAYEYRSKYGASLSNMIQNENEHNRKLLQTEVDAGVSVTAQEGGHGALCSGRSITIAADAHERGLDPSDHIFFKSIKEGLRIGTRSPSALSDADISADDDETPRMHLDAGTSPRGPSAPPRRQLSRNMVCDGM